MHEYVGQDYYSFIPYDYGPFDANIYRDAEELYMDNLIIIRQAIGQRWFEYIPTPGGLSKSNELRESVNPKALEYLEKVVTWIKKLSFREILRVIYREFPSYKVKSVFKDTL